MKVYVAAGFAEKGTVRAIHRRLRERGHAVTVDWTEHEGVEEHERDRHSAVLAGYAERDFGGIVAADAFVLLAEPSEGRAMDVELGIALHAHAATGRPLVYVVGAETNQSIFYYHSAVRRRRSIDAVIDELGDASDVAIVSLPIERWPEFKRLRLDALAREPDAFTARIEDAINLPDEAWRRRLANPDAVLRFAERAGRLVGMAGAYLAAHDAPDVAVVFGVYVDSAHRGHGIGRRLIAAVLDDLGDRGTIRTARLGVNADRPAALALYRSLGFAVVGREERDEPRPWVELTMERPIR